MAALGFELVFVKTICNFWKLLSTDDGNSFDVVITDYDGLGTAGMFCIREVKQLRYYYFLHLENSGQFPLHHCKYFLVDGFGTQAPFNKRNMDLKKILTPYPFDNSNTAIHLVTGVLPKALWVTEQREDFGLLWAKLPKYLTPRNDLDHKLLQTIKGERQSFLLHAFMTTSLSTSHHFVADITSVVRLETSLHGIPIDRIKEKFELGDNFIPATMHRNRTAFLKLMTSAR